MVLEVGETVCLKNGDTYTIERIEIPPPKEVEGDYDSEEEHSPDYNLFLKSSEEGKPQIKVSSDDDGYTWYLQESDTQTPRQFWLVKAVEVPDYDCFCEGVVVATSARQARDIAYRNWKGYESTENRESGCAPLFWLSSTFSSVMPMDPNKMNGVVMSSFNAG